MFLDNDTFDALLRGFLLAMIALVWVVVQIRVVGLRSLSKMTTFDFVMTVALGSLLAGAAQADEWLVFAQTLTGMLGLFVLQVIAGRLRKSSDTVETFMQNAPVLLMRNGKINHTALKETRVAESDLYAKLREANVLDMAKVQAVVLETTGDVSVLHGDSLQESLLQNVECDKHSEPG
ncbi:DUF421 domain-containing protein [Aurantiacibacter gangjinensis]|uniref:YetF C-terminal domain-containing protein n=1 Tax=Aurantiacibacter gangjinensis TaxID=502682 RepID=A0A0G9MV64_9SPHN|nr:YetF domain-containing protein [Aurantiacibacter gangjinensis]APE29089.1 conserved hypothetical protein-putative membrane protein [Aurantiacibacter gangjinensis]KLE33178.1 hypothetical protein AAW01_04185 [Aurantiacibacter gangjinensis]